MLRGRTRWGSEQLSALQALRGGWIYASGHVRRKMGSKMFPRLRSGRIKLPSERRPDQRSRYRLRNQPRRRAQNNNNHIIIINARGSSS